MELAIGRGLAANFIAGSGALDSPLVLVDIGARDGIHPRWRPLEPALEVYGFDAIADVVAPNERHHYFKIALGDRDGECRFHVPENVYEAQISPDGAHVVPIAKLDTLWANAELPPADFIKIDCEGWEPEILRGAERYLAASNLLGAEIETNFLTTPNLPMSHFAEISAALVKHRLLVASMGFIPVERMPWDGLYEALFARHLIKERDDASAYAFRTAERTSPIDTVLKLIAIFDVYALARPARALVEEYRSLIAQRIDPDQLYENVMLTGSTRMERYLPHLGLGLWTGIRRLAHHAARRRGSRPAN